MIRPTISNRLIAASHDTASCPPREPQTSAELAEVAVEWTKPLVPPAPVHPPAPQIGTRNSVRFDLD